MLLLPPEIGGAASTTPNLVLGLVIYFYFETFKYFYINRLDIDIIEVRLTFYFYFGNTFRVTSMLLITLNRKPRFLLTSVMIFIYVYRT